MSARKKLIPKLSAQAVRDWSNIKDFVGDISSFDAEFRKVAQILCDFPDFGKATPRPRYPNTRCHPMGWEDYLIFYRVNEKRGYVLITHIRHGSRRPLKILPLPGEE